MTMRAKRYQNSAPPLLNPLNPLNLPNPLTPWNPLTSFACSQWDDTPRWLTTNFFFFRKI